MSGVAVIWVVALGLGVVVMQRRSVTLGLVCIQSGTLALLATLDALEYDELWQPAVGLWLRVIAIAVVLGVGIARSREVRPVAAGIEPIARFVVALVALLLVGALLPPLDLASPDVERGAIALVALGIVIAMTRRATIIQILGIIVAENAATMLALSSERAVPVVIELGVVFDLILVAIVATAFHARIFGEFGSGDSRHLRGLRD